jgi:AcrR family transcriptional regulator
MNREDKRVRRTRGRLAAALIELSSEKGYDAVTIQEITGRAGINYRTFFRHYEGKDDLLRDVLRTTLADLQQILQPPAAADFQDDAFEEMALKNGRLLYEYVGENSELFEVFLQSGPAAFMPIQELAQAEAAKFIAVLPEKNIPQELLANHMVASTFSFIRWWLENDMSYTPQQMGEFAAQLIMLPIRRLLLGDDQARSA